MCRGGAQGIAVFVLLLACTPLGLETLASTTDEDECMSVSLLQADVAVKSKKVSHNRIGAEPSTGAPSHCAWPSSGDMGEAPSEASAFADGSTVLTSRLQADTPPEGPEAPASADGTLVFQVRCLLGLLSLAMVVDSASRWRSRGNDSDSDRPAAPQPKQTAPAQAPARRLLHTAAFKGDVARCKVLLEAAERQTASGALQALVCADSRGYTAMHAAASGGSERVLELLLQRRAQVDPIDRLDETPLHLAARGGHADACALLVEQGASLWARNAQDHTPLAVAGHAGQEGSCERLLDYGAGPAADIADEDLPPIVVELLAKRSQQ